MALPDFESFLDSLDWDELNKAIIQGLDPHFLQVSLDGPESLSRLVEEVYHRSVSDAAQAALTLIREYHEWLRSQI